MVQRNSDTSVDKLGHLLRSFTAPLMYLCRVVTLRYCMDVTVPFDPGAAGLVLVQASPELTSNMSFPFYKPVWTSTESLCLHSLYLYSAISIFYSSLSESSQSISIYDRGIGAKNSVSISISRFLKLENLLYTCVTRPVSGAGLSAQERQSLGSPRPPSFASWPEQTAKGVGSRVAWRPSPEQGRRAICVGGAAPVFPIANAQMGD